MALGSVKITVGQSLGDGRYSSVVKGGAVPNVTTVTTDLATVSTDVGTLVADGASPTQGHVTTLNTDLTALNTAYTALKTALAGDVVLIWDGSVVTSRNQLLSALRAAIKAIDGGYGGLAE